MPALPLYTEVDYGPAQGLNLNDYTPDIWDAMRGGFLEGLKALPSAALENWYQTHGQYMRDTDFQDLTDQDAIDLALDGRGLEHWYDRMPLASQKQYIERMGLTGQVEPNADYEERALRTVCEGRQDDNALALLRKNMGWQHLPFSLAAGMAAGFLDPLAIASAFVPAIPEERALHMLAAQAHSAIGRAGMRAVQGAASGAVGGAALEPLIAIGQNAMQRDYDMTMSLCNVGAAAVFGAALHPVAGHVGEWLRRRHGQWQPWEMGMATAESEALRNDNARLFEDVRMAANPAQDRTAVRSQAIADAMTWDASMRHIAWLQGIPTQEAYARNKFAMFNGERYRQEAAANEAEVGRWTREVSEQEELARMRQQFPDLRIGGEDGLAQAQARLDYARAKLVDSSRKAAQDLEAMFAGDSLYARGRKDQGAIDEPAPGSGLQTKSEAPSLFQFARAEAPGRTPAIMGATTFPVDGRAVVRIFEAHDFTTVSHELAHVLRRQYQQLASSPNATPLLKKQYRAMARAFGVTEAGHWDVQAEELFAESYVRYMLTGQAPSAATAQAFGLMREQAAALYADADSAGVNISAEMRAVFDHMLVTPMEQGDRRLREAIADLATRRWEQEFLPRPNRPRRPGDPVGLDHDPSPSLAAAERGANYRELAGLDRDLLADIEYLQASVADLRNGNQRALAADPGLDQLQKERISQEWQAGRDRLRQEAGDIEARTKMMEEYLYCLMR